MALKRDTSDIYGRSISDTYIRIVSVEISYKNKATAKWAEYYNANSKHLPPISTGFLNFEYEDGNICILAQAYESLKLNDIFATCVDV